MRALFAVLGVVWLAGFANAQTASPER